MKHNHLYEVHPRTYISGVLPNGQQIVSPMTLSLNKSEFVKCMLNGNVYATNGERKVLIKTCNFEAAEKIAEALMEEKDSVETIINSENETSDTESEPNISEDKEDPTPVEQESVVDTETEEKVEDAESEPETTEDDKSEEVPEEVEPEPEKEAEPEVEEDKKEIEEDEEEEIISAPISPKSVNNHQHKNNDNQRNYNSSKRKGQPNKRR